MNDMPFTVAIIVIFGILYFIGEIAILLDPDKDINGGRPKWAIIIQMIIIFLVLYLVLDAIK